MLFVAVCETYLCKSFIFCCKIDLVEFYWTYYFEILDIYFINTVGKKIKVIKKYSRARSVTMVSNH